MHLSTNWTSTCASCTRTLEYPNTRESIVLCFVLNYILDVGGKWNWIHACTFFGDGGVRRQRLALRSDDLHSIGEPYTESCRSESHRPLATRSKSAQIRQLR